MLLSYGLKEYPDVYVLYARVEDEHGQLAHSNEPIGRINAKDYIDFAIQTNDAYGYSSVEKQTLTLETPAMFTFNDGDFLFDVKNSIWWKINTPITKDDGNQKGRNLRPRKKTILHLTR